MARILENQTNALPADLTYPYGDILDDTGANDGVPVNRAVYADIHQFFARLADQATLPAIVLNDQPDNSTFGFQFYEALLATQTTHSNQNAFNIGNNLIAIGLNTANIVINTAAILDLKKRVIKGDFGVGFSGF